MYQFHSTSSIQYCYYDTQVALYLVHRYAHENVQKKNNFWKVKFQGWLEWLFLSVAFFREGASLLQLQLQPPKHFQKSLQFTEVDCAMVESAATKPHFSQPPLSDFMFLPKNQWSSRFEETFYTVKVEGFQLVTTPVSGTRTTTTTTTTLQAETVHATPDAAAQLPVVPERMSFPAYYYHVVVNRGHGQTTILRRYSQFLWLYHQIQKHSQQLTSIPVLHSDTTGTSNAGKGTTTPLPQQSQLVLPHPPPKTCPWDRQDDVFAACRQDELSDFLEQLLSQGPGVAKHPAVRAFLEL